ncbi:toll/interleukin-1 receptor domain-containing protein [Bradyrhizobium sp. CCBAU 11361]|uniref:toll/interleukin-1 receptor domain-containing protein n=1 Tax=Bradyrhizobium sp. CCBAU 11361 TaxID=1630812 RepID=UPI003FA4C1E8
MERVWLDEAEIDIGDSLIAKIEEGMKLSRYIAVVLSKKSIGAPWVKKELDVAMNREIASGRWSCCRCSTRNVSCQSS